MESLPDYLHHSPYLTQLAARHPELMGNLHADAYSREFDALLQGLQYAPRGFENLAALMRHLRIAKAKTALLVAMADLRGMWSLEQVTHALSRFAESSLSLTIDNLLAWAAARGEIILPHVDAPSRESGLIILGMGKLGAYELNYSSDIDLIIFYERGRLEYQGRASEQKFFSKLAQDIVQVMQERTADGYVFRTDLRLRPDPASTPPAVNTDAAMAYYEGVGQNWERAAMIKARALAGDIPAGETFLKQLSPFMWRRSLDFNAINDIHSIKRQMDARGTRTINVPSHNIKTGLGGIREIEFYVQIHQLIWGGREPRLRTRGTCDTLRILAELNLVAPDTSAMLIEAYGFLRKLEHRLQMVADQQTHSLPDTEEGVADIAAFMGYADTPSFTEELLSRLNAVHAVFADSFRGGAHQLGADAGNLAFTGVTHDPDTLETISRMGYTAPEVVSDTIMGWHHGSRRCTRTKRARELLTELTPALLTRLAETADPDAAFLKFDEFLKHIPAGVQLFSLFSSNPQLLALIADILGSAPVLAETLSRHPDLLDSVLFGSFYGPLPTQAQLSAQLADILAVAEDFEERMEMLRRFKNEKQFQAGVQLLKNMITAEASGAFLSDLADVILTHTLQSVEAEFERSYGRIPGSRFAVISMGRLGSREMTFGSDMDLVFIYDVPDFTTPSDGEKSYTASVYYNRLTQRVLTALTTAGREGRLYEVDTRLRPFGNQGLSAVSIKALRAYFAEQAWTFEFMALTRGRAAIGEATLCNELNAFILAELSKPREREALRKDVGDMRARVEKEFPPHGPWNLKYAHGGYMELDFIAQYLFLANASALLDAAPGGSGELITRLRDAGIIPAKTAEELLACHRFLTQLLNVLRLCHTGEFDADFAMPGLKKLLAKAAEAKDFADAEARLTKVEQTVHSYYKQLLGNSP